MRLAAKGRVTFAIADEAAAEAMIRNRRDLSGLGRAGVLYEIGVYPYLHKRHGDLARRLAETLKAMEADGSFDRITAEATEEYYLSLR